MKLNELLQTPDEIVDFFKGLIFSKDDKQSLFDGSTKEMVSVDMLKEKNILLFISSLNISSDDISTLIPIYIGIRKKDKFKIVWIPIVEQWTNYLRMQFEMLRSDMPWYIMQYFSPVAGIKFIKEEWHFDNEPIVVELNSQGDVKNKDALDLIREVGMDALVASRGRGWYIPETAFSNARGPHENDVCTFYCGGNDTKWIQQFCKKFNVVAEDPLIAEAEHIFIKLHFVGKDTKQRRIDEDIQELLRPFKKERRWAMFMNGFNEVINKDGATIVAFLERFEQWKGNVRRRGIETCFKLVPCHQHQRQ
ncbi:protein SIEVE ELEMENT OCCLUSION B-like [Corylus avellana]|uniref:protein SIEVE ELEMENT OCCLUSION B-like n=1 Tax=Corylus avellana TaxID=13451 RepID=UPI00286BD7EA|nr:protein SIEVE ELEMENT OCCLUSION B-like [Corylus avellana]